MNTDPIFTCAYIFGGFLSIQVFIYNCAYLDKVWSDGFRKDLEAPFVCKFRGNKPLRIGRTKS
jgi:hypothetical protein